MRIPKANLQSKVETEEKLYEFKFCSENDLVLLKALAVRFQSILGGLVPHSCFEGFCEAVENLVVDTCVMKIHDVEVNVSDLYRLREKITKIIEFNFHQKFFRTKIKIGTMRVNLKVNRNDEAFPSKNEISDLFMTQFNIDHIPQDAYIDKLEKRILQLEHKLNAIQIPEYLNAFPDTSPSAEDFKDFQAPVSSFTDASNQYFNNKKFALVQLKLLNDKEWDAFDAKILKAKCSKKLKKLSIKKSKLTETENSLRKKNIELEKEKNLLEKAKEAFDSQKSRFLSLNQSRLAALSEFISELGCQNLSISLEEPSTILKPDLASIDTELNELSAELKTLEFQYKSRKSLNQYQIASQIEHVKNRVSTLKSLKAIQNLSKPSISTNSSSYHIDKSLSPRNAYNAEKKIANKPDVNETELRRQLRVKELRIKEREEEILDHEEKMMRYWQENLECKDVIKNTLKAFEEFRCFKDKYERRIDFVEKKRLELQETLIEIGRRENDLVSLKAAIESEKTEIEQQKQDLASKVRQLIVVLERN